MRERVTKHHKEVQKTDLVKQKKNRGQKKKYLECLEKWKTGKTKINGINNKVLNL
jgi:DNA-binding transcriptional regulator GbsR (MarR family)